MVPESYTRRALDIEDYLNIARRNVSWFVGPTLAGLVIAVVVAFFWPDTYLSVASIRVVPPQVPQSYVQTNVTVQMADRVNSMQQTILSRNTLTNIIKTYDLYRKEQNRLPFEDIIEKIRNNIVITNLRSLPGSDRFGTSAFQIGFYYENRYVAQKVTRDLMTRFIDENIRERSSQSQMTTQFLKEQYSQAKANLDAIEQRLTQFRLSNMGRLPDQMQSNVQQMSGMESRVAGLNANISRVTNEKLMAESELRGIREKLNVARKLAAPDPVTGASPAAGNDELENADREIAQLERVLERMLEQYQPTYPDVLRLQARLQTVKKQREGLLNKAQEVKEPAKAGSAPAAAPVRMNPAMAREIADLESQVQRLQGQIRVKELEIERYVKEIGETEKKLSEVQRRIEVGPIGAQQLEQLSRDYELAKKRYDELQLKVSHSEVATDLENRKQGETLEVLDLPSLPETPTDPNRLVIVLIGLFGGLVTGVVMVVVRELKDTTLKTLKDVRAYTQFNVLGSVPLLENDLIVRRRKRVAALAWATSLFLSVVIMSGSIYYYYSTKL